MKEEIVQESVVDAIERGALARGQQIFSLSKGGVAVLQVIKEERYNLIPDVDDKDDEWILKEMGRYSKAEEFEGLDHLPMIRITVKALKNFTDKDGMPHQEGEEVTLARPTRNNFWNMLSRVRGKTKAFKPFEMTVIRNTDPMGSYTCIPRD